MTQARRPRRSLHYAKPRKVHVEWITFALTSLIVAVLVGLVIYVWVTEDTRPPILQVTSQDSIRQVEGQYYVPFTVTNVGGGTAESVQVVGELRMAGEVRESGEQQIDFLSSGEQQEGSFVFTQDPDQGNLSLRVASYKLP